MRYSRHLGEMIKPLDPSLLSQHGLYNNQQGNESISYSRMRCQVYGTMSHSWHLVGLGVEWTKRPGMDDGGSMGQCGRGWRSI